MKTTLKKKDVATELGTLRNKIRLYVNMDEKELTEEYNKTFPEAVTDKTIKGMLLASLIMSATYYMSNALDLD